MRLLRKRISQALIRRAGSNSLVTKTYWNFWFADSALQYSSYSVGNCFSRSARTLHFAVTIVRIDGRTMATSTLFSFAPDLALLNPGISYSRLRVKIWSCGTLQALRTV